MRPSCSALVRSAFTLFEVGISLMLVTVAVLTVLMLMPMGIKAQQMSRYQLFAAAKANELIENFSQCSVDFRRTHDNHLMQYQYWWDVNATDGHAGGGWGRHMFGSMGQFDIERQLVNSGQGNYPLPTAIARRLESPGDEIQKVLDDGGQVYYCDPSPAKISSMGSSSLGVKDESSLELQRMVWGVTGYAQENCLPLDPLDQTTKAEWPFPPQSEGPGTDWVDGAGHMRSYKSTALLYLTKKNYYFDPTLQDWVELTGGMVPPIDPITGQPIPSENPGGNWIMHQENLKSAVAPFSAWSENPWGGRDGVVHGDQDCTWQWYFHVDEKAGKSEASSIWMAGHSEYARLAHYHYGRIRHQLHYLPTNTWCYKSDAPYLKILDPLNPPAYGSGITWVDDFPGNRHGWYNPESMLPCPNPPGGPNVPDDGFHRAPRAMIGIPAPAHGLPNSPYHGNDILYEDHETWANTLLFDHLREGLPSLERRVEYRTAALVLWAKVQSPTVPKDLGGNPLSGFISGPIDILKLRIKDIGSGNGNDLNPSLDPNIAQNYMNLPNAQNPLLQVIDPPNPKDIHPSQVLALSYLAHAAMMVCGYQPPFINDKRTPDPTDDEEILPSKIHKPLAAPNSGREDPANSDDTNVFRLFTKDQFFLWDVMDHEGGDPDALPIALKSPTDYPGSPQVIDDHTPFRGPLQNYGCSYMPSPGTRLPLDPLKATDWALTTPNGLYFEQTADGQKIQYHRMHGNIINPYPAPYADRDAFTWWGAKTYGDMDTALNNAMATGTGGDGVISVQVEDMKDPSGNVVYDPPGSPPPVGAVKKEVLRAKIAKMPMTHNDTKWARNAHETFLRWAMAYVSENPYDFIVPRPFNRQVMTDRPLFAWHLFDSSGKAMRQIGSLDRYNSIYGSENALFCPYSFNFFGFHWVDTPAEHVYKRTDNYYSTPSSWGSPYFYSTTDPGYGVYTAVKTKGMPPPGTQYPSGPIKPELTDPWSFAYYGPDTWWGARQSHHGVPVSGGWGSGYNFTPGPMKQTATTGSDGKPYWWYNDAFQPAQRCRQLVFWNVAWKDYADAESQPSAPVDCTQLARNCIRNIYGGWYYYGAMTGFNFFGNAVGNPEQEFVWVNPERDGTIGHWPKGQTVAPLPIPNVDQWGPGDVYDVRHPGIWYQRCSEWANPYRERWSPYFTIGFWGADRNHNGRFDQGPVSPTVRMRAAEVARFNFYDPVAWTTIRN